MFTSFDENAFWTAVQDKNYSSLKVNTVSTIRNDPVFAGDETAKVLAVLKEHVPDIFEKEVLLSYEERLAPAAWDKTYFIKLTCWFQENFAESRIPYIKEVGRAVYQNKIPEASSPADEQKTEAKKASNFPLVSVLTAVGALAALVVLLITLLKK